MTPTPPTIRLAGPSDAAAIARVHVGSWREAYRGLLPDSLLDGLTVEARAARWTILLAPGEAATFVATRDSAVIGFGSAGPQRDAVLREAGYAGEVLALYVLREGQRCGIGRALMGSMAGMLDARGCESLALWVLEGNAPARRFYEAVGGVAIGTKEERRGEETVREVAYGWRDLSRLVAGAG